jgi:hypothetical protein
MIYLAFIAMFVLLGGRSAPAADGSSLPLIETRFPPTFEDNAWAYGFALFSLTVIAATSAAILSNYWFEFRRDRAVRLSRMCSVKPDVTHPLTVYRFQIGCLLTMALIGTLPDVLVLLAWGEASDTTMWALFQIDRIGDGMCVLPFGLFMASYLLNREALDRTLTLDAGYVPIRPRWVQLKDKVGIVVWALVIALGATLFKAGLV